MTVAEIQCALLARGYDRGPSGADGDAGPLTNNALGTADVIQQKAESAMPQQPALDDREGVGKVNNPKVGASFTDTGFTGEKDNVTAWSEAAIGDGSTNVGTSLKKTFLTSDSTEYRQELGRSR